MGRWVAKNSVLGKVLNKDLHSFRVKFPSCPVAKSTSLKTFILLANIELENCLE
jgi:hypothetical protein